MTTRTTSGWTATYRRRQRHHRAVTATATSTAKTACMPTCRRRRRSQRRRRSPWNTCVCWTGHRDARSLTTRRRCWRSTLSWSSVRRTVAEIDSSSTACKQSQLRVIASSCELLMTMLCVLALAVSTRLALCWRHFVVFDNLYYSHARKWQFSHVFEVVALLRIYSCIYI